MDTGLKQDGRLLRREYYKALFPVMFSVLGATINALIDSVFVSQRLGENALAAVNLSMPVYLVLCTIGSLISSGAATISARAAGAEDMKKAQNCYCLAFMTSAAVSVVFTVLGIIFCRPVSALLAGGSEQLTEQVYSYCLMSFIGSAVSVMVYLPFSYLQLEGKNKAISVSVTIMVVADVLLDILFLFVLDFGLTGASAASVISTAAAAIYGFIVLNGKDSNYRFKVVKPDIRTLWRIIRYGSPAALGNLFDAVKLLALNMIIIAYVGAKGAAVWAVLNTLSELSLMIVSGVPRAAAPMIGAYHSAKENGGIRLLTGCEVKAGLVLSTVYAVLIAALNVPIGYLFAVSSDMLFPIICLGVSVIISTLCGIWEKHFNAIGLIEEANIAAGARCCVLPVTAAVALMVAGAELWMFLPLSAIGSVVVVAAMIAVVALKSRKTDRPLSPVLLLDDKLTRDNKVLDFSIGANMDEVCDAAEKIKEFCAENDMNMKMTMKLGLAIEELLSVIIQKTGDIRNVDLRVFALNGNTGIRIRCAGKNYDPFKDEDSDEDFLMGINMLNKLAETTTHIYTLGMNMITIIFPEHEPTKK